MFNMNSTNLVILSDDNFESWFFQLKNILMSNDLDDLLIEDEDKSNATTDVKGETSVKTVLNEEEEYKREKEFKRKQAKARYCLFNSLTSTDQNYVNQCTTVQQMITMLRTLHFKSESLYVLNEKLLKLRWNYSDKPEVFINELNKLKSKIVNHPQQSKGMDDTIFVQKVLKQMPNYLRMTKMHFEFKIYNGEKVDYQSLCNSVVQAYHQQKDERKDNRMRNNNNNGREQSNQSPNAAFYVGSTQACHHCGSVFHKIRNCPDKNKQVRPNRYENVQNRMNNQRACQNQTGSANNQNRSNDNQSTRPVQQQSSDTNRSNTTVSNSGSNNRSTSNSGSNQNNGSSNNNLVNRASRVNSQHQNSAYCVDRSSNINRIDQEQYVFDDASNIHITNSRSAFVEYESFQRPERLSSVNGGQTLGVGVVEVVSFVRGVRIPFKLSNVHYIPTSPVNIFSKIAAQNSGMRFSDGEDDEMWYIACYARNGDRIATASRPKNTTKLYLMNLFNVKRISFYIDHEWHRILNHVSYDRILTTQKCVDGMKIERSDDKGTCEICVLANLKRRSFKGILLKETVPGRVLHTDICTMPVKSIGGALYYIVFSDEASRFLRIYFMKDVSATELSLKLLQCLADQKADIGMLPDRIHCDQGKSYLSKMVGEILLENLISMKVSCAYDHEENGLAERTIQDVTSMIRASLKSSELPSKLWAEAANNSAYIMNRLYKKSIGRTPFEAYFNRKPNLKHLHAFGSKAYLHVPKSQRKDKLSDCSKEVIFVGHTESDKIFRVANLSMNRVTAESNVKFYKEVKANENNQIYLSTDELMPPNWSDESSNSCDEMHDITNDLIDLNINDESFEFTVEQHKDDKFEHVNELHDLERNLDNLNESDENNLLKDDLSELVNDSSDLNNLQVKTKVHDFLIHKDDVIVPKGVNSMLNNRHREQWEEAMDREFIALIQHCTWNLVPRNRSMNIIRGHWIFSVKTDQYDFVNQFKARWVIDGSNEDSSLYAPVINSSVLRLLLANAVKTGMEIHVLDVENAYLSSKISSKVYMNQVDLYEDLSHSDCVCELQQSLYGLPESPYNFFRTVQDNFKSIGLISSRFDPCVYYNKENQSIVGSHVDDFVVMAPNIELMNKQKDEIRSVFQVKDKGQISQYLGMNFTYDKEVRSLMFDMNQKIVKLKEMIDPYLEMKKRKLPKATVIPLQPEIDLYIESPVFHNKLLYQRLIGMLNYVSLGTRPDICVYVNQLSRFLKLPTECHFEYLIKLIAYVFESRNLRMQYIDGKNPDHCIYTYADAGEQFLKQLQGKRTTGIVSTYNLNVIHWQSKTQSCVTGDICEGELFSINAALRSALMLRNVLDELGITVSNGDLLLPIFCDNKAAVGIATNGPAKKSKHYELAMFYANDYVKRGEVVIQEVKSSDNIADVMTKFVTHEQFKNIFSNLNLV